MSLICRIETRRLLGGLSAAVVGVFGLGASVQAQPMAHTLMLVGRPLPNTNPPFSPSSFASASVITNGSGWVTKSSGAGGSTDFIWGQLTPAHEGQFYAISGTLPPPNISGFLQRVGFDSAGNVLFSGSNPWSLWNPSGPIAKRPDPLDAALASGLGVEGKFYGQFLSTYGLSESLPVWRATWQPTQDTGVSNTNEGYSLIRGFPNQNPQVLLATGHTPTGAVAPIGAGTPRGFDTESVGFARGNSNFIVEGFMQTGINDVTTQNDGIMVMNGAVMQIGGGPVRERSPMLVDNIFPDEQWENFAHADVNTNGDWLFVGDTFSSVPFSFQQDLVLVHNGRVKLREANTVLPYGSFTMTLGSIAGDAVINEDNDWLTVWSASGGGNGEVLILNGEVIALGGVTQVDTTGDGLPDSIISDLFNRTDAIALSDRFADDTVNVYFLGAHGPSNTQGVFMMNVAIPEPTMLALAPALALPLLRRRRI